MSAAAAMTGDAGAAGAGTGVAAGGAAAGAGVAAGAAAGAASGAGTGAATGTTGEWLTSLSPENRAVAEAKGWNKLPSVNDVIGSTLGAYRSLETMLGADKAGRAIVVPKDGAEQTEVDAFQVKMGRPEKVDGYKIPDALKADPVANAYRDVAFKNGISGKQFDETMAFIGTQAAAAAKAQTDKFAADVTAATGKLRGEWGQAYQRNMDAAVKVTAKLGWPPETIDAMAQAHPKGAEAFFRELSQAGQALLEAKNIDGTSVAAQGQLSPSEAIERQRALGSDKEFQTKLKNGNAAAKLEWDNLVANRAGLTLEDYKAQIAGGGGLSRSAR